MKNHNKFCKCCGATGCMGGMYIKLTRTRQTWVCRTCILRKRHAVVFRAIEEGQIDISKVLSNQQAECVHFCTLKRPPNCGERA